jgi:hypothetical protein
MKYITAAEQFQNTKEKLTIFSKGYRVVKLSDGNMLLRMSLTGASTVIEHIHYNVGVPGKVDQS